MACKRGIALSEQWTVQSFILFVLFTAGGILFSCVPVPGQPLEPVEASFYGESYILTPVQDASSSTSISLEFRTHLPQGLLLLAAGQTDYITVQLNAGIVETRVNLGSGEGVAFSARGVRLDDSRWHRVEVNRTLDTVFLSVDNEGQGQASTPGTYYDLNIDLGLYLGGTGNLKKDFYRNAKSFRGCLREARFNGRKVMEEARALKSAQNAFQVSWHCDREFTAPSSSPISFSSDTSFAAFPHWRLYPTRSGSFSCELKTRSQNAVVLFNSGQGQTWEDYIAVELVNGKPRLSIDKGSGVIEVALDQLVSDGQWHKLEVSVSERVAELHVDSKKNLTRFHLGEQNVLNLAGQLLIGGVGFKSRSVAIKLGLHSLKGTLAMKGSLLGCVRNVMINSRSYGFQQIQSSRLIDPGCAWEFPCAQDPCISDAECTELEGTDFRCDCDQEVCVREEFRASDGSGTKGVDGIVSVKELMVAMGGVAVINTDFVSFAPGIQTDGAVLRVTKQAQFGHVESASTQGRSDVFSISDLLSGQMFYKHFGGQSGVDSATFQVTLPFLKAESKVADKYDFVLPIRITSVPRENLEIELPYGNIIAITSDSKIKVSTSMVNVTGYDTAPSKVKFAVLFRRQSKSFFELKNAPGRPVTSFTLEALQNNQVWFQHRGDKIVYTKINVTDGVVTSRAAELRLRAEELRLEINRNTGIAVSYGSDALITRQNLSASTNMKAEQLDIDFRVLRPPRHGVLQIRADTDSEWVDVERFTQEQVDNGLVRYRHLPTAAAYDFDHFKFEVSSRHIKLAPQDFNIIFKVVTLTVEQNSNLVLRQKSYGQLTDSLLMVVSNVEKLELKNIVYTITRPPVQGSLFIVKGTITNPAIFDKLSPLKTDDTFSQQDISDGFVYYSLDKVSTEPLFDSVDLQASYFGFTIVVRTMISYEPQKTSLKVVNLGLRGVPEGGSAVISAKELRVDMENVQTLTFNVLKPPRFGSLDIVQSSLVLRRRASYFTMREIKERKVVYTHDDSEHAEDSFMFLAHPMLEDNVDSDDVQELSGTFQITVDMKNDNAPVREVNKVYKIAIGQNKLLTDEDLSYTDPDVDFDSSLLAYSTNPLANGQILSSFDEHILHNFTESDLRKGALMLQHTGTSASFTRLRFEVSDGLHRVGGLLEIQASPPSIDIINNTGVVVERGEPVLITGQNLSMESNLDYSVEEVSFRLLQEPKYGLIQVFGKQVGEFSYSDLLDQRVRYWHDGSDRGEDQFQFAVLLDDLSVRGNFLITVVAEGLTEPPRIVHNQILRVSSMQTEVITENLLQVAHQSYQPSEIEFIVTQLPQFGQLIVRGRTAKAGSAPEFSQQDIINGDIAYVSQSLDQMSDLLVFDVGTEYQSLRHVEFLIEIIAELPLVKEVNGSVVEGGALTLTARMLGIKGRLAQNKKTVLQVEEAPAHGKIVRKDMKKTAEVNYFGVEALLRNQIVYIHDNSESLADKVVVRAYVKDGSMQSQWSIVEIKVLSVDDQAPRVVVNTGLNVWVGSVTLLSAQHLQASDPDTSSAKVEFHVSSPTNGHLAYLNNSFKKISKFSQLDIDSGSVVFVHEGAESGEFKFQVSDGTNSDELRTFFIQALPVELILSRHETLMTFPQCLQPITNETLLTSASAENFSHPIVYTLTTSYQRKGKLVTKVRDQILPIRSFTQQDVNERKVFFQHNSYSRAWEETESLEMEISATYARPLAHKVLNILISYSNINADNYRELLNVKEPSLKEGDQVTISQSLFDSSEFVQRLQSFKQDIEVEFSVKAMPEHGYLWFNDEDAEEGEVFSQQDLNKGALVYKHDHSNTVTDFFQFNVKILVPRSPGESSRSATHTFNFTVSVIPVNDNGFQIISIQPKLHVLQGEQVPLLAEDLTTVDLDTGPEGIEYIIIKQPDNGMLVRLSAPTSRISSFTQKEINIQSIVFKHDGSRQASSTIELSVSDRVFEPRFTKVDIEVTPLEIKASPDRGLPIVQGSTMVTLSNDYLKISTNGEFDTLTYQLRQAPQFGKLLKKNRPVKDFSQADVDEGNLIYIQDPDSPGDDFFVCDINLSHKDCSLDTVQFDIIVMPLIKQGPLVTSSGSHVAITKASLDVSRLAELTNDIPWFDITEPPQSGNIMKKLRLHKRSGPSRKFEPISRFTFEDVMLTTVYYVAHSTSSGSDQDKFSYTLNAKGVPPAHGQFLITLEVVEFNTTAVADGNLDKPAPTTRLPPAEADDDDDEADNSDEHVKKTALGASDDEEDNNVIIIATVLSLLAIAILAVVLVILFIRWRRNNRRSGCVQEEKVSKPRPYISGPLQLEQPHVLIEPQLAASSPPGGEDIALMPAALEDSLYVNTSHINSSHEADSSTPLILTSSPDVTRVEVTQTVPGCKVTPLSEAPTPDQGADDFDRRSTMTSGRASNASNDLTDWTLMDPDLLQHCRTTTPVLRQNQYWL